jgi:hypothetical protein
MFVVGLIVIVIEAVPYFLHLCHTLPHTLSLSPSHCLSFGLARKKIALFQKNAVTAKS